MTKIFLLIVIFLIIGGCGTTINKQKKYDPVVYEQKKCYYFINDQVFLEPIICKNNSSSTTTIENFMVEFKGFTTGTFDLIPSSTPDCNIIPPNATFGYKCFWWEQYKDRVELSDGQIFYYDQQGKFYNPDAEKKIKEFKNKYKL